MANKQVTEAILAWQTTLAKYQKMREEATTPKQKAFFTRNINRAKRTILAFERAL